jgi:ankyrin repeat protein
MIIAACQRQPNSPLTRAAVIRVGQGSLETPAEIAEVRAVLSAGAEVNASDGGGLTALMWAAREGRLETMKILLDAGADANLTDSAVNNWPALIHAIHKGQSKAALLLLARGADPNGKGGNGTSALSFAAGYGATEIVKALLERGADPRADGVFENAVGGTADIDYLGKNGCATEVVRTLLERAPDLKLKNNLAGKTARFMAKRRNCTELLALLEANEKSRQVAAR